MLQGMAHMERASDVWRRNGNRENRRIRVPINFGGKAIQFFPTRIMPMFGKFWIVCFGDFHKDKVFLGSLKETIVRQVFQSAKCDVEKARQKQRNLGRKGAVSIERGSGLEVAEKQGMSFVEIFIRS
jgi:hypothetical protein